ncbi:MAG TPA: hypothetical protein VIE40_08450 [Dehalococcoidia bacterium]
MSRISKICFAAAGVLSVAVVLWALAMPGGSTGVSASPLTTGTAGSGTVASGTGTVSSTRTVSATGTVSSTTATPDATSTKPASTPTQPPATATATQPAGGEGCTPGFWKNHTDTSRNPNAWPPTGLTPGQSLDSLFTIPSAFSGLAGDSLLTALEYHGGPTAQDAAQILLRSAVAAVLNADHPDIDYPMSSSSIITQVNAALATGDRGTILTLQGTLDADNNLGCTISGH